MNGETPPSKNKSYIGDSCYVEWSEASYVFILTTDNGDGPCQTIYLEPEVARALQAYMKRFVKMP